MEKQDVARAMPGIRQGFERLKEALAAGRMAEAGATLYGESLSFGEELKGIYFGAGRDELSQRDPLTRFFVTRFRGMPVPAELEGAPADAMFLMAFTAFPYLDALMEELTIGEHDGFDADGHWLVRRVLAGEDEGATLRVLKAPLGWRFDLMPVYQAKADALSQFLERDYAGDFDAFLWRYVADHDLMFDMDQAWRPLTA